MENHRKLSFTFNLWEVKIQISLEFQLFNYVNWPNFLTITPTPNPTQKGGVQEKKDKKRLFKKHNSRFHKLPVSPDLY